MQRRLEKMAELASVRALQPQPWFPCVRPRRHDAELPGAKFPIDRSGMFYFPGVAKRLDGRWLERCVNRWLEQLPKSTLESCVLDAHFGYPEGVGCWRVAQRRGIPVFITLRGLEVDLFRTRDRGPQLLEALGGATGVIAVSHSLKASAVAAGAPADHITVIPNGVDTQLYCPGDRPAARTAVGYSESTKLIVSVGNLKPVKGHDTLLHAMAEVVKQLEVNLVCIGGEVQSPWGIRLQQLSKELGIDQRVQFLGSQTPQTVVNWLRAADLFCLASRREGCCNAVLEALATGCPVAVTNAGDNRIIVKNQDMGQVCPVESPTALAQSILETLGKPHAPRSIAAGVSEYTWPSAGQKTIAYFSERVAR
ncbi:D-inositol 3-phosphate glycosyltransferase [Aureliella helgolandensis]|uniref:D-inositol 3-phosphate glycosyltransferase n=1 Tax=Aureliella helgolandensis TaxID=2527968 RepID=A0A518GDZ8_9BACT|nr:D-inositol 3-phosphate glycosyltransferase [Aureliella helgolandensis]